MSEAKTLLYNGYHKIEEVKSEIKGRVVTRERLLLPSAVGGVVEDTDGKIALVTQYRPTVGLMTKEIPAGVLDKGKSNIQTFKEELYEECEIKEEDIIFIDETPVREYFMVTGSSDAKMFIYVAKVKEQNNKGIKDDHDVEAVEWVTLAQMEEYIANGQIVDSKTLLAYEYLKRTV